jgi:hypothetical protein
VGRPVAKPRARCGNRISLGPIATLEPQTRPQPKSRQAPVIRLSARSQSAATPSFSIPRAGPRILFYLNHKARQRQSSLGSADSMGKTETWSRVREHPPSRGPVPGHIASNRRRLGTPELVFESHTGASQPSLKLGNRYRSRFELLADHPGTHVNQVGVRRNRNSM